MEPLTMGMVSLGMQAVGAIQQGAAEAARQQSAAAAADWNAARAREQAQVTLSESTAAQIAQQRKTAQVLGLSRAAAAESGVGFRGSNADVLERTATLAELDQLNVAYEGAMRARSFNSQGQLDEFNANIYRRNASAARGTGVMRAAKSVIDAGSLYASGSGSGMRIPSSRITPSMSLNGTFNEGFA